MRELFTALLLALGIGAAGQSAIAQAQTAQPQATITASPQLVTSRYTGWAWSQTWPGWMLEYRGGAIVAGWEPRTDKYQLLDRTSGRWLDASAPWHSPTTRPNFGVNTSKLATHSSCSINGHPVPKDAALRALAGEGLPDDKHKLRMTVIGSEHQRKQVLADWEASPALAPWKDKVVANFYAPDFWAAGQFQATADPTIILQAPDGQELSRTAGYPGDVAIARAIAGAYDPKKTPDLAKPSIANLDGKTLGAIGAAILALVAFFAWRGRSAPGPPPVQSQPVYQSMAETVAPLRRAKVLRPGPLQAATAPPAAEAQATTAPPAAPAKPRAPVLVELVRDYRDVRKAQEEERKRQDAEDDDLSNFLHKEMAPSTGK